jgi:hypothetical protein
MRRLALPARVKRTGSKRSRDHVDVIDTQGFMGNKVVQIQRGVTPFAAEFLVRLRYAETVTVATTSSVDTASTYSFRLNSLYDPNYTGTGHQPYQFDQLTPIYNNYLVNKAEFKVTIRSDFTTTGVFGGVSVFVDTNVSDSAQGKVLSELREKAVTQVRCLATQGNRANWPILQGSVDMARVFGVTQVAYQGELNTFGAVYNANPSRTAYLELCLVDPGANTSSDALFDVEITYFARLYGYKGPAQS